MLEGLHAFFARPEDVIVYKMIYSREGGSERHVRDILGMLRVSGTAIDSRYVAEWAARLGLTRIWDAIVQQAQK